MANAIKRVKKPATITPMARFVMIVNPGNEYLDLGSPIYSLFAEKKRETLATSNAPSKFSLNPHRRWAHLGLSPVAFIVINVDTSE